MINPAIRNTAAWAALFLLSALQGIAQTGKLDTRHYTNEGASWSVSKVALLRDSSVMIGGSFTYFNGRPAKGLAKMKKDGTHDYTFDAGQGVSGTDPNVLAIAQQADGKLLVGGTFTGFGGGTCNRIVRLNADGSVDGTFSTGSGFNAAVRDILVLPDSTILVAGEFNGYKGTATASTIIRLKPNGNVDSTFSPYPSHYIYSIARQADGKLLVGGIYHATYKAMRRLNANGSLDTTFNSGGAGPGSGAASHSVYKLAILSSGKICVSGAFPNYNGSGPSGIAVLNADGSPYSGFSAGTGIAAAQAWDFTEQADGKIVVVGNFGGYNGTAVNRIVRIEQTGARDTSFATGSGFNDWCWSIVQLPGGSLLAGGRFSLYNTYAQGFLAKINPDGSAAADLFRKCGLNGTVYAIGKQGNGKTILAGNFTRFNERPVRYIVRLNADGDIDTTFGGGTGANNAIRGIVVLPNDKILVAGQFGQYSGNTKNLMALLNADGTLDNSYSMNVTGGSIIYSLQAAPGGKILAGGSFSSAGGNTRRGLFRLKADLTLDGPVLSGSTNYTVTSAVQQPDGKIVLAGTFANFGTGGPAGIARLDTLGNLDTAFHIGTGAAGAGTVEIQPDGKVLIGGTFTQLNGTAARGLARLKADGARDSSFVLPTLAGTDIRDIMLYRSGILVGGTFASYNGAVRSGIAYLDSTGAPSSGFDEEAGVGGAFTPSVNALYHDAYTGRVLAGGAFTSTAAGIARRNFAAFTGAYEDGAIDSVKIDTLLCAGGSAKVVFKKTKPFNSGNVFTVLLSDSAGSFASPVAIGSKEADGMGWDSVIAVVPSGTITAIGYKTKIVSSNAVGTSSNSNPFNIYGLSHLLAQDTITVSSDTSYTFLIDSFSTNADSIQWAFDGSFTEVHSIAGNGAISFTMDTTESRILYIRPFTKNGCVGPTTDIIIQFDFTGPDLAIEAVFNQLVPCTYDTTLFRIKNNTGNNMATVLTLTLPGTSVYGFQIVDSFGLKVDSIHIASGADYIVQIFVSNLLPGNISGFRFFFTTPCSFINSGSGSGSATLPMVVGNSNGTFTVSSSTPSINASTVNYGVSFPKLVSFGQPVFGDLAPYAPKAASLTYKNEGSEPFNGYVSFVRTNTGQGCDSMVSLGIYIFNASDNSVYQVQEGDSVYLSILPNDTVSIKDTLYSTGVNCNTACNVTFRLNWGCQSDMCQIIDKQVSTMVKAVKGLVFSRITPKPVSNSATHYTDNSCNDSDETEWQYLLKNTLASPVFNITVKLSMEDFDSYTYIRKSSLSYSSSNMAFCTDSVLDMAPSDTFAFLQNSDFSGHVPNCFNLMHDSLDNSSNPLKFYMLTIPRLDSSEAIVIKFNTYRCCPSDTFLFNRGVKYNRWKITPQYYDFCLEDMVDPKYISYSNNTYIPYKSEGGGYKYWVSINGINVGNPEDTVDLYLHQTDESDDLNVMGSTPSDSNMQACGDFKMFKLVNRLFPSASASSPFLDMELFTDSATQVGNATYYHFNPAGSFFVEFAPEIGLAFSSAHPPYIILKDGTQWIPATWAYNAAKPYAEFRIEDLSFTPNTAEQFRYLFSGESTIFYFLQGCCQTTNAEKILDLFVNTYVSPRISNRVCSECKIPLSKKNLEIQLRCPGCVLPGIIVTNNEIKRLTRGFRDINNNGRPEAQSGTNNAVRIDNGTAYAPDSVGSTTMNKFIPGDEFLSVVHSYIQEGESAGGFTYQQWQSYYGGATLSQLYIETEMPYADELGMVCTGASVDYYSKTNFSNVPDTTLTLSGITATTPLAANASNNFQLHLSDNDFGDSVAFYPNDRFVWKLKYKICNNLTSERNIDINNAVFLSSVVLPSIDKLGEMPLATDYGTATVIDEQDRDPAANYIYYCEAYRKAIAVLPIVRDYKEVWGPWNANICASPIVSVTSGARIGANYEAFPFEFRSIPSVDVNGIYLGPQLENGGLNYYKVNMPNGYTPFASQVSTPTQLPGLPTAKADNISLHGLYNYHIDSSAVKYALPVEPFTGVGGLNNPAYPITDSADGMKMLFMFDGSFNQVIELGFVPTCSTVADTTLMDTSAVCAILSGYHSPCSVGNDTVIDDNTTKLQIIPVTNAWLQNISNPSVTSLGVLTWPLKFSSANNDLKAFNNVYVYIDTANIPSGFTPVSCNANHTVIFANGYYFLKLDSFLTGNGPSKDFSICFALAGNLCDSTPKNFPVGLLWDCDGYPDFSTFSIASVTNSCNHAGIRDTLDFPGFSPLSLNASANLTSSPTTSCGSTTVVKACLDNNTASAGAGNIGAYITMPSDYTVANPAIITLNGADTNTIALQPTSFGDSIQWQFAIDSLGMFGPSPSMIGANGLRTGEKLCIQFEVSGTCNAALLNGTPYKVYFTGQSQCGSTFSNYSPEFSFSLLACSMPAPIISFDTAAISCAGHDTVAIIVASSGTAYGAGTTFTWSNGMIGDTIHVLQADTAVKYTVTVSSDSGCVYTASIVVPAAFGDALISIIGNACHGGDTLILDANTLNVNNGHSYTWSTGAVTDSIHVVVQNGATYTVTVSSGAGCIDSASIALHPINAPVITVTPAGFSCTGVDSISLVVASDTGVTYVWNTGDSTGVLIPDTTGIYIVTVANTAGCQASDTVNVTNAAFTGIVVGSNVGIANVTAALAAANPILPMPTATSNSQIIIVDGAFTIDQNYTFAQGSEIIARGKAVINVPSGKTLTIQPGVHLYGCDTLWQGIVVSMGGGLVMNGTEQQRILVEDAVYGVRLNNNCSPSIGFVTFNNNYIGIYVGLAAYSGIPNMLPCVFNRFTSTTHLKPVYSGYNPGSLPMPSNNTNGYCGIYLRNVSMFSFRQCEFSNICNGAVAYNSKLSAVESDFNNLLNHGYTALASYIYPVGTGVYMRHIYANILTNSTPSSVIVQTCNRPAFHFEKCLYGVYSDGAHTDVRSCNMDSITAYGISVRNAGGRNINISNNTVSVGLRGISVINSDPVLSMSISKNKVFVFGLGNMFAGYGVEIAETGNPHNAQPTIHENFVFNAANSFYGFWNNGTNGHLFRLNRVTLINPTRAYAAIAHTGAIKLQSQRNGVLAFSPSVQNGTGYPAAFAYDYSNGTYECDSSQGTYTGVYMYGQLGSSQMRGYSIGTHTNGLHVARYANMQAQPNNIDSIKNGIMWVGNYTGGKAALNENLEVSLINQAYANQLIYPHVPSNILPYNPNSSIWATTSGFIDFPEDADGLFSQCGINGVGLSPDYTLGPFEILVIKDSIQYDVYEDETKWQDRWAVYTRLMEIKDRISIDSTTQAFISYCDSGNIGKLYAIQQVRQAGMLADSNLLALQAKVDSWVELLAVNDSVRSIDTASIWQVAHIALMDSLYAADSLLQVYTYIHNSLRNATLDSLVTLNNTLTQGNTAEDNMIRFNDVYMKTLARDSIPNRVQELEVNYLAYQCPLIGGQAVYKARTMALLIQDTVFDNQSLCYTDSGILRVLRKPTDDKKTNIKPTVTHNEARYSLYPNPASNKVKLSCNTTFCADCHAVFYDVFGRETMAATLPYGEYNVELDIQHLETGLYLVHITNKNGDLYTTKLNVVK